MNSNVLLKDRALAVAKQDGVWNTGLEGVCVARRNNPTGLEKCMYRPMIIYMVQGTKKMAVDNMEFVYRTGQCIVTSIDLPAASSVIKASEDEPMLCMAVEIDAKLMANLLRDVALPKMDKVTKTGVGIINADETLTQAFVRLLDLRDTPNPQREVLASFLKQEIYYRLLWSPIGNELRQANTLGTQSNQIVSAIEWLKEHFAERLNMEDLADRVHMSPTSFYRNFNKLTRTTPVQYQKQLRLYEAQRLLLFDKMTVEGAGYRVGYKSPNQFNRDYKKMFGASPKVDVQNRQM
jgi:AraC-like DNA-binding protein